jgi:hypothetical protein
MPETNEGGSKEFAAFLKGVKSVEELRAGAHVSLRGVVFRSGEKSFAIATADGTCVELEISAVERFKVIDGGGIYPEVEISVSAEALRNAKAIELKVPFKDLRTDPIADYKVPHKDAHTDPITDQKLPIKDLRTDPIADYKIPMKDMRKDPITDPTTGVADFYGDPGAQQGDPAFGQAAAAAGMSPFVMATPHQAPAPMVAMQNFGANPAMKPVQLETVKEASLDQTIKEIIHDHPTFKEIIHDHTLKEVIADPTYKELVFDTFKEPAVDTRKELVETTVEGGPYTAAETVGIPGGFPGMPGF